MTPDAPDVAEMVAALKLATDDIRRRASRIIADDGSRGDQYSRGRAMGMREAVEAIERAIAERLRARGGDHDAG